MDNHGGKAIFEILMVEESQSDILLMREAFKVNQILSRLNVVSDGEEALDYLNQMGKYSDTKIPDFILLDLHLPRMDGLAFLKWLKSENLFKSIPVFVLSGSSSDADIQKIYELNAACYIVKPSGFDEYVKLVKKLHGFWMNVARLPPLSNPKSGKTL